MADEDLLKQFTLKYQKEIQRACDIANSVRGHLLGGATEKEIAVRTGWTIDQVRKCIKHLTSFKLLTHEVKKGFVISETKYFIDFEPMKIQQKIQREKALHTQRMHELNLLQEYFSPSKSLEEAGTSTNENDTIK
jgi:transcription initiation factor IIE alpha subunit